MLFALVALVVQVASLLQYEAVRAFSIYSRAMAPTLEPGDELLGLEPHVWGLDVTRGTLVAFERPVVPASAELAVKRVVAVAGDEVEVRRGRVRVNGAVVRDPPVAADSGDTTPDFGPYRLPEGSIYVLGDNAPVSEDSTLYGPIPVARVRYVIWLRHAPWARRCSFRGPRLFDTCSAR